MSGARAERPRNCDFRPTRWHGAVTDTRAGIDGIYLSSRDRLPATDANLIAMLVRAARDWPDAPFLSQRNSIGWIDVSYADFAARVTRLAWEFQSGDRVAILARNSVEAAIASFAVMARGGAAVPLSPLYLGHRGGSDLLHSLAKLAGVNRICADIEFVEQMTVNSDCPVDPLLALNGRDGLNLDSLAQAIAPDVTAKILFTSGSTGAPKAVPNSHAMLCAAAAMIDHVQPRLIDDAPFVQVDWLPWHHTYGGNVNLHNALSNGGHFYIDHGAPTPAGFATMVANLAEIGPHGISTVPSALPPLLDVMERDTEVAHAILRNLHMVAFGGAPLHAGVAARFQRVAQAVTGCRIMFGSGYGMTETSGVMTLVHWPTDAADLLGAPLPGVELKLVDDGDGRFECRVRGPNVFAGYVGADPAGTFDEEGFFRTGDAVRPKVPGDWTRGVIYDGRVAEDFKLANGVWVRAGPLRSRLRDKLGALVRDVLIVGSGRDAVGVLAVPGTEQTSTVGLRSCIAEFNAEYGGGVSTRIARADWFATAPDPATGEVNAKGELNAIRIAHARVQEIERLYDTGEALIDRDGKNHVGQDRRAWESLK